MSSQHAPVPQQKVKRDLSNEIWEVLNNFHREIFHILKLLEQSEPNNVHVAELHRILYFVREMDPTFIIERCKDKLWEYHEQITNEDMDFFRYNKFSKYIKNDKNKTFMYTLIELMKQKVLSISEAERKMLWNKTQLLTGYATKYKYLMGEFKTE
jgi:hypothetical protein